MLDHEALALIALGFFRCFYVSLYCPDCGYVRWVTPEAPEGEYCDCPACARAHCNCGVVGAGFTNKQLPRFEVWWTPPVWIVAGEVEEAERESVRVVDDDRYISPSGRIARLGPRHAAAGGRPQAP